MRRSARSVRAPARLAEEAPAEPIASDDDSSNASADDSLHRQIAELQAQLRKASVRPDAATASASALDADVRGCRRDGTAVDVCRPAAGVATARCPAGLADASAAPCPAVVARSARQHLTADDDAGDDSG